MKKPNVISAIEELLYQHDCVVVPGYGAFIGNYRSARFSVFGHKLYPPSKEITFNPKLFKNDGLLVSHLAHDSNISYDEALSVISEFVKSLKYSLGEDASFLMGDIGKFVQEGEKVFFFQNDASNYLLSSWGLRPLIVRPVSQQVAIAKSGEQDELADREVEGKKIQTLEPTRPSRDVWKVAAVILPLMAIGMLLFWFLPYQNQREVDVAGVELAPCPLYQKSELPIKGFESLDIAVTAPEPNGKYSMVKASAVFPNLYKELNRELMVSFTTESLHPKDSTRVVMSIPKNVLPREYIVVLGCFSDRNNANNYVRTLQSNGYPNAQIIDLYKGLNRVGIASGFDKQKAVSLLGEIRNQVQPESWLARK